MPVEVRCQDAIDLMSSLTDNSVQLICTDPPFGIGYQSNRKSNKDAPIAHDWNFNIAPLFHQAARVLEVGGAAYVFTRWDTFPQWASSVVPPLELKNFIVWVKDNHSAGDLSGNFGFKWIGIMMLVKGRHLLRGHRWPNVWEFGRVSVRERLHPAEKPVDLLVRIVKASSDVDGLVVDPYCGSGSFAEAAQVVGGRRVLVGDIDPTWADVTRKRMGMEVQLQPAAAAAHREGRVGSVSWFDGIHPGDIEEVVREWQMKVKAYREG